MEKNILISLVSDQTLPNVELIKEFDSSIDEYIFIYTHEKEKQLQRIIDATNIKEKYKPENKIVVDAFDVVDIEKKLKEFDFSEDNYIVNITCGTKLMILIVQDFFKNLGAKIYYLTGYNKEYIKLFPAIGPRKFKLKTKINLSEYLLAYGFKASKESSVLYGNLDQAVSIFDYFLERNIDEIKPVIEPIRLKRGKKSMIIEDGNVKQFLEDIEYPLSSKGKLNKKEIKYLSGDWFEEYIYFKVKEELGLDDDEIYKGVNLEKENTKNELDVMFVYLNKLYIIECKTSIVELIQKKDKEGHDKEYKKKLLPEIIYKSDALKAKFGLFAKTSVVTLEEIKDGDNTPINGYEDHFRRAKLSNVNIISRKDLKGEEISFKKLLNIK